MYSIFFRPKYIYLYNELSTKNLRIKEIEEYLRKKLKNIKIKTRDDFLRFHTKKKNKNFIDRISEELARCKISEQKTEDNTLLSAEIEYERKKIKNPKNKSFGIVYDGFKMQNIFCELLLEKERNFNFLHIVFTNQLFATIGEDKRFHLRISVYGMPSIISTTGIVEAPAKEKEYYLIKNLGKQELLIKWKKEHKQEFIDYDDDRLTDVLKGYVLQSLFYYLVGNPFCNNKNCKLFNAHWQREVIHSQINSPYELCKSHQNIIEKISY